MYSTSNLTKYSLNPNAVKSERGRFEDVEQPLTDPCGHVAFTVITLSVCITRGRSKG